MKNSFNKRRWGIFTFVYAFLITLVIFLGTYGIQPDFTIEPEYITGILTASSILFGFWFVMLERIGGEIGRKIRYQDFHRYVILWCLCCLAVSVIAVFLVALDKAPPMFALAASLWSFFQILYPIVPTLWHFSYSY